MIQNSRFQVFCFRFAFDTIWYSGTVPELRVTACNRIVNGSIACNDRLHCRAGTDIVL